MRVIISESRSNSMGATYTRPAPSDVFGSQIQDFGEFPTTPSSTTVTGPPTPDLYFLRHSTAPAKVYTEDILDFTTKKCPPNTAPAIVNPSNKALVLRSPTRKVDILRVNHEEHAHTDDDTDLPGTASPPQSKSDGDLLTVTNREILNNVSNSHSDTNFKQHQQCCTGFGSTTTKNRNHANGCVLI